MRPCIICKFLVRAVAASTAMCLLLASPTERTGSGAMNMQQWRITLRSICGATDRVPDGPA